MTSDTATLDGVIDSPPNQQDNAARNRLVIAILLVSTFVVFLNETIMSVAIPHLMGDLGETSDIAPLTPTTQDEKTPEVEHATQDSNDHTME